MDVLCLSLICYALLCVHYRFAIILKIIIIFVDRHRCHMAAKFEMFVDEDQSKLPALYWLPKLRKQPYKWPFVLLILVHVHY